MPPEAAPAVTNGAAAPPPPVELESANEETFEQILDSALDAQPKTEGEQPEAPPEKSATDDAPPEEQPVELTDAALEKAIATPEGRKRALKSIRDAERVNRQKYLSLKGWEGKLKSKSAAHKEEVRSFTNVRQSFMADLALATSGTTEEALNALTRIRAGSGQKGEDFLSEAQLSVARNGKKPVDPEVASLRKELEELKRGKEEEQKTQLTAAQEEALQRRRGELVSTVADNPAAFPTCNELGRANRQTLLDIAVNYKTAYHEARKEVLPDAEVGKLIERDLAQLRAFPSTLAYARLGHLSQVVGAVTNLAKTQGLDDTAALRIIENELRSNFGAAPQGDAGQATSARAEPDQQAAMPGKSPSSRASATGATRAPTQAESLEQFEDLFAQLGMN